jgi:hypothetical protein
MPQIALSLRDSFDAPHIESLLQLRTELKEFPTVLAHLTKPMACCSLEDSPAKHKYRS